MSKNKLVLKPGQVDFTHTRWAPVVNCVVKYKDKILLVERSAKLNLYPGYWNGISGFLDDQRGLEEKVKEELREELGLGEVHIRSIHRGEIFDQEAPEYKKTWVVHPVLVEVDTDKITLNWEAKNYKWIMPTDAKSFKLLPGFDKVLKKLSPWLGKEI